MFLIKNMKKLSIDSNIVLDYGGGLGRVAE